MMLVPTWEDARLIGRGAEGCALHVRGGGINTHDWEPAWSVLPGADRRGFRREHGFDVSPRMIEAPQSGIAKGKSIAPHLEQMVDEYYALMGWDEQGRPIPETLKRLGLEGAS